MWYVCLYNAEGEVEDHHEKKSVMKKVKAKAKKLKDTIAGYGHQSHEQDGQRTPDDHDLDEEDDEEVDSPEAHGAPSKFSLNLLWILVTPF